MTTATKQAVTVGQRVICNGYPGTVTKICGWSNSMVEVRLHSGLVCVDAADLKSERAVKMFNHHVMTKAKASS